MAPNSGVYGQLSSANSGTRDRCRVLKRGHSLSPPVSNDTLLEAWVRLCPLMLQIRAAR